MYASGHISPRNQLGTWMGIPLCKWFPTTALSPNNIYDTRPPWKKIYRSCAERTTNHWKTLKIKNRPSHYPSPSLATYHWYIYIYMYAEKSDIIYIYVYVDPFRYCTWTLHWHASASQLSYMSLHFPAGTRWRQGLTFGKGETEEPHAACHLLLTSAGWCTPRVIKEWLDGKLSN